LATTSASEALEQLAALKKKNEVVALFVSDQRMPEMDGVTFLGHTKEYFPDAKKVLLTAYSDTTAAIKAINDVQLDYYLLKPWDPPAERLYPVLFDLLESWKLYYRPEYAGIHLVGYQYSPKSHVIKDFLAGNLIPFQWHDIETDAKGKELLALHQKQEQDLPVVIFEDGEVKCQPDILDLANKVGLRSKASARMYDVAIIGAGPAGLAAAVYGASEGLKTLLIERQRPGGQAGTSSRIENYLGFPRGLSGGELTARAVTQATRFGAELLSPQEVKDIEIQHGYKVLHLVDGSSVSARAVVITTGVNYRHLDSPGVEDYVGAGVYYGAAMTEAQGCRNQDVYVVGGGNSAGQAAVYLSRYAKSVNIVIRRADLSQSMSQYLIEQIGQIGNIHLVPHTVIASAKGDENKLTGVMLENINTGEKQEKGAQSLFIFIGAKPCTDWMNGLLRTSSRGYIETGDSLKLQEDFKSFWQEERDPYLLETSVPGVFAAGDVRAGAMNRVASAVGEGAMSIKFTHQYLG